MTKGRQTSTNSLMVHPWLDYFNRGTAKWFQGRRSPFATVSLFHFDRCLFWFSQCSRKFRQAAPAVIARLRKTDQIRQCLSDSVPFAWPTGAGRGHRFLEDIWLIDFILLCPFPLQFGSVKINHVSFFEVPWIWIAILWLSEYGCKIQIWKNRLFNHGLDQKARIRRFGCSFSMISFHHPVFETCRSNGQRRWRSNTGGLRRHTTTLKSRDHTQFPTILKLHSSFSDPPGFEGTNYRGMLKSRKNVREWT
jgi:hypothetical protein